MTEAQEGIKQKNPWHRHLIAIITVLMVVGVVALVTTAVVQNRSLPQKLKYGIVLDAGSSHTALYIYQWPAEKMNDTGLVQQLKCCNVKGPGISSYWMDVGAAGRSLKQCLDEAKETIPEQQHRETPVYLGATAGMRLLSLQNHTQSERLLHSVEEFISFYPFNFQGARIINGQDEGAFGWITINYLMENFLQDSAEGNPETLGAMDLGGASTQITFVPDGKIESEQSSLHFRLYGKSYNMYTHSYLCYGKDQALKLLLEKLNVSDNGTIFSPCFNKGYTRSINVTAFYNSPCTPGQHSTTHQTVSLIGTGDSDQCSNHVRSIFNFTSCTWSSCSFDGVYQPEVQGRFGAFSAFYFVMKFFNLVEGGPHDPDKVKQILDKFCSRSWDEIQQTYLIKEKYLSEYCFSGHYILILLNNVYNFTSSNWNTINFMKKIKGSDAGWTLGYMLNLTNMIPAELPYSKPLTQASYTTVMVIFSLLLVILILLVSLIVWKRHCRAEKKI
uniref:ectonucleoside triphosphate diphosphohydrolase 1 n=1 Tax=Pristiophorus japonicus TaxID=55135 RepID=UPI00398E4739